MNGCGRPNLKALFTVFGVTTSRSLTDAERRFSQSKRETLAVISAIERLHIYLYGGKFALYADCKPMELILGNPKSRPRARIEHWNLRIQDYTFDIVYRNGIENPSDFLSRHTVSQSTHVNYQSWAGKCMNVLASHAVPKSMTLLDIQNATLNDQTLQNLAEIIENNLSKSLGLPLNIDGIDTEELKLFAKIHTQLTVNAFNNITLRGSRIILPKSLRLQAITIAHEGHQCLVRTRQLLREKVWFPGIDKEVQDVIADGHYVSRNISFASRFREQNSMSKVLTTLIMRMMFHWKMPKTITENCVI